MSRIVLGLVLAGSVGSSIMLGAAPARAQTYNFYSSEFNFIIYPGSNCKYYGKQASDNFFTFTYSNGTAIKNTDSQLRQVTCPILREYYPEMPGDWDTFSNAVLNVSGTNWTIPDCILTAGAWDGSQLWEAPSPTLTLTSGGVNSQYFWTDFHPPEFSVMAVWCGVPAGRWINKLEVRQRYPDEIGEQ